MSMLRPAFAAGLMFVAVRILMPILEEAGSVPESIELVIAVAVGITVYVAASAATNHKTYREFLQSAGAMLRGREVA
jgi:hypothetical protein